MKALALLALDQCQVGIAWLIRHLGAFHVPL